MFRITIWLVIGLIIGSVAINVLADFELVSNTFFLGAKEIILIFILLLLVSGKESYFVDVRGATDQRGMRRCRK